MSLLVYSESFTKLPAVELAKFRRRVRKVRALVEIWMICARLRRCLLQN